MNYLTLLIIPGIIAVIGILLCWFVIWLDLRPTPRVGVPRPDISKTVEKVLGPGHKRSVTRFTCFRCHKTQLGGHYCHHCGAPLDKTAKLAADAAEWRHIAERGVTLKAGTVLTTSDGSPPAILMHDYSAAKFDELINLRHHSTNALNYQLYSTKPEADQARDDMLRRHGLMSLAPLAALSKMFWWADCGLMILGLFVVCYMISEWRRRNYYDKPPGFKSDRDLEDEVRRHTARNKMR